MKTLTAKRIAEQAMEQMTGLTGLTANTVSSLSRGEDGWRVSVEMTELRRIPDSQDILGSYECLLDENGELLSYQRTKRYSREETGGLYE